MPMIGVLGCILIAQSCVTFGIKQQQQNHHRLRYRSARASLDDPSVVKSSAMSQADIFNEIMAYRDKRAAVSANKAEPTCEELRAMWIYSKRQSRAAETTNDLPMYRDPFSYNIWDTYPVRSPHNLGYRADNKARSRGAGGAIIYGKVVHKAPAGSRFRNGMPNRMKTLEEASRMYGTVNRQLPDPRRRPTNFRIGGGGGGGVDDGESLSPAYVPQSGSFQHLKDLVRTERARQLQEQRDAEEMAARAAVLREIANGENNRRGGGSQETRRQFFNSLQPYQEAKDVNYGYGQSQYVPNLSNFGDPGGFSLNADNKYNRDTMLHRQQNLPQHQQQQTRQNPNGKRRINGLK